MYGSAVKGVYAVHGKGKVQYYRRYKQPSLQQTLI